ncbi:MAG TPA: glycine--tRNA ligase subunit beta [Syntrophales bacterium]|nr:glycine--tRNA ligase subunit beta [Syntrophales bacterium]HPQ44052.1 glycine--tRNA ligase subunit beta [Syntrophales bacterium]
MAKELLLEIGTEEIPAAFMPKALEDMERIITKEFSENRIGHGRIQTMGTPRRLLLSVLNVDEKQEDQLLEKMGPSTNVAFDKEGNPTKAAIGFARGQGMDVSDLEIVETPKGKQICARKKILGEDTKTILTALLPRFIMSIPFRKSMRWMDLDIRFPRPIHWMLALFGNEVVPFSIENITSGNTSCGHRFMAPDPFTVDGFEDYLKKAEERFVIVDPERRKKIIQDEAKAAAQAVSGSVLENEDLLGEVSFLVEYPSVVCGTFDREYLTLPKEVLTTAMMKHQKYFPVIDSQGKLLPHFITVNNTVARDPSVVTRGNEKVIRARLADARFFFEEDQKTPLENHLEDLKDVVFHRTLGTSYEKVMQFRELATYLTEEIGLPIGDTVDRVAILSKADLETQMVYEFTELQGVMGREYALLQGENPVVAQAIYEHYLPIAAGGDLPETDEGAIVSIADKMDTIVGFFGINLIPTGTADPFALRRQALGIINIILTKGYAIKLDELIGRSIAILGSKVQRDPEETKANVLDFFKGRFENQLVSQGHPYDVVNAVLALGISDIVQSLRKIEAMENFKTHPDFEPLAIAFKRVVNILKEFRGGFIDAAFFDSTAESNLYDSFINIRERANGCIDEGRYSDALSEMATLRKPVDAFFEEVMVMAEDEKIRFNRLSLLEEISDLFYRIADFSRIVTES